MGETKDLKKQIAIICSIIILLLMSISGCLQEITRKETTSIIEIINNESDYLGKEVTVKGIVVLNTNITDDFPDVMGSIEKNAVLGFTLLSSVDKSIFEPKSYGWIGSNGPYYFTGIVKKSILVPTDNRLYIETSQVSKA